MFVFERKTRAPYFIIFDQASSRLSYVALRRTLHNSIWRRPSGCAVPSASLSEVNYFSFFPVIASPKRFRLFSYVFPWSFRLKFYFWTMDCSVCRLVTNPSLLQDFHLDWQENNWFHSIRRYSKGDCSVLWSFFYSEIRCSSYLNIEGQLPGGWKIVTFYPPSSVYIVLCVKGRCRLGIRKTLMICSRKNTICIYSCYIVFP